ncbi:RICIN domain-containing protein [Streptomyces sp. NBC_00344]|uniref:RICIN domain-containing protein n=1 Tax=Streptomyces sp. NBC_00344 TaxID=2975720 RepID=UPI002E20F827
MSIWTSIEPASTTVDPGSTTTVRLRLRNTGDIVDEYRCVPVGDIAPYITVEPATIRLYPGTTGTVELTFAPPRTPDATAGPNPYGIQITPTEHPGATTVPEGNLTITPFTEVRAELVPHTVKGRFRGRPKLAIDNIGNTRLTASVNGSENGDQLSYEIHPANVQIEPGRAAFVNTTLRPRNITWFGRKENRPYRLAVQRSGTPPLTIDGTYVQKGFLPRWLATFLAVALALTVMFVIAWFAYKPQVHSLATEQLAESGKKLPTPTPSAPLPQPSPSSSAAALPVPSPKPGDSGGGSGGGKPKTRKKPDPASASRVLIKNTTTGKCANLPGFDKGTVGGDVTEWTCDGTANDNQLWNFEVRYAKGGPNDNSLFQIRNVKDDFCMDLPERGGQPATTHLRESGCDGTQADNQLWWLDKQSDGHYWIRNYASNHLCLDVSGYSDGKDATPLTIYECSNTDDQEWIIVKPTTP